MTLIETYDDYAIIGRPIPKKDAAIKATGDVKYADDMFLPGMLYGKLLRNPHPHARIVRIDTSRAEKLAGVRAVITGRDFPGIKYGNFPHTRDYLPLAIDRVRYIGEEVAAVARHLMDSLVTMAEPREREVEAVRARTRNARRFGGSGIGRP